MHTAEQFKKDLIALGLRPGDSVMIHCSYKSLGGIEGGAKAIFAALEELLGEEGTLILPALSYDYVNEKNPVFDLQQTPSCVGYLPEYFRKEVDGVIRSMHATHSCCLKGKRAKELAEGHALDQTPVGIHSPISKLPLIDGKILILGSHPDHNTALHGVEEKANAPYIFNPNKRMTYILKDGTVEIKQQALRHDFKKADCYYDQKYARILDLLSPEDYSFGKVLDADCYLMNARAVWEKGVAELKNNPYYFVDKIFY